MSDQTPDEKLDELFSHPAYTLLEAKIQSLDESVFIKHLKKYENHRKLTEPSRIFEEKLDQIHGNPESITALKQKLETELKRLSKGSNLAIPNDLKKPNCRVSTTLLMESR